MIDPSKPDESSKPASGKVENFPSLPQAMRRARIEAAEHSQGFNDLRSAELARLELLLDELKPVLEQVPTDVDLFDTGLVPGEHPRLFIDMIAFVQMARDRRTYRFVQDRRDGRLILAENTEISLIVKAITDYIARRLIERDKALAGVTDFPSHWPRRTGDKPEFAKAATISAAAKLATAPVKKARRHGWFIGIMLFLIEFLGVACLLAAIIAAGFYLYLKFSGAA